MLRALVLSILFVVIISFPRATSSQAPSVLHIKVVLVDAQQNATPVARHALLISDNPASAVPRRIVTGARWHRRRQTASRELHGRIRPAGRVRGQGLPVDPDGGHRRRPRRVARADSRQRRGRARQHRDDTCRGGGGDRSLVPPVSMERQRRRPVDSDHASVGFLIDAKGLIATNQRSIGTASSVEVQLTQAVKVAAVVLVADPARDVASCGSIRRSPRRFRPCPLGCALTTKPPVVDGQEIWTIGAPLPEAEESDVRDREPRGVAWRRVRLHPRARQCGWTGLHSRR